jgi:transposase
MRGVAVSTFTSRRGAACILLERGHKPQKHLCRFGCTTRELRELAEWLRSFDVRHVAMESTGVYWKPVWNVLEEHFHMVLANAQHIKAVPAVLRDGALHVGVILPLRCAPVGMTNCVMSSETGH